MKLQFFSSLGALQRRPACAPMPETHAVGESAPAASAPRIQARSMPTRRSARCGVVRRDHAGGC